MNPADLLIPALLVAGVFTFAVGLQMLTEGARMRSDAAKDWYRPTNGGRR